MYVYIHVYMCVSMHIYGVCERERGKEGGREGKRDFSLFVHLWTSKVLPYLSY